MKSNFFGNLKNSTKIWYEYNDNEKYGEYRLYKYTKKNEVILESTEIAQFYVVLTKTRCTYVDGLFENPRAPRYFFEGAWEKEPIFPECN